MRRLHTALSSGRASEARWVDDAQSASVAKVPRLGGTPAEVRLQALPARAVRSAARALADPLGAHAGTADPRAVDALRAASARVAAEGAHPAIERMMRDVRELLVLSDEVATFRRFWLKA